VHVKIPGKQRAKLLDDLCTTGIFLRYTSTNKKIVYVDLKTNQKKISSHVVFDKVNFTSDKTTTGYKSLIKAGIQTNATTNKATESIKVIKIHENTILRKIATENSAGLDLCAIENFEIDPQTIMQVRTEIAVACHMKHTGGFAPTSSGNTDKKKIDI